MSQEGLGVLAVLAVPAVVALLPVLIPTVVLAWVSVASSHRGG